MASERVNPEADPAMVPADLEPVADGCAYAVMIAVGVALVIVACVAMVAAVGR